MNTLRVTKKSIFVFVVSVIILFGILAGYLLLNRSQSAYSRDLARLADMRQAQEVFESVFRENFSYQALALGCQEGMRLADCLISDYFKDINKIKDPGDYSYLVTKTPDKTSFEITFYLEKGTAVMPAGEHTLSELGIR